MDPISLLLTALLTQAPVVTDDGPAGPHGCHPEQVVHALRHHVGPAIRFDEVIVGYDRGLAHVEVPATAVGIAAHGKGAVECATQRVVAFGLGPEDEHRVARLCPPARTPATVACVRPWADRRG